ncbi:MAG TPA: pyrimidine dimer DNA glycosylase/endonuclease V [Polyangia bacterium]
MRLWSLHPSHLDVKGLLALWREGLLAQKVLLGQTRGYTKHPQLDRFRATGNPVSTVGAYLSEIYREASRRGYRFDQKRIVRYASGIRVQLPVTRGQLRYEWEHLLRKLSTRDRSRFRLLQAKPPKPHPLFRRVAGPIEPWERIPSSAVRSEKNARTRR